MRDRGTADRLGAAFSKSGSDIPCRISGIDHGEVFRSADGYGSGWGNCAGIGKDQYHGYGV